MYKPFSTRCSAEAKTGLQGLSLSRGLHSKKIEIIVI